MASTHEALLTSVYSMPYTKAIRHNNNGLKAVQLCLLHSTS